jgi:hypothetical protein
MELEDRRVGTRVRVRLGHRKPDMRASVGTIEKRYCVPDYVAFEVSFPDGRTELFWDHQLEPASPRPKWWWAFW